MCALAALVIMRCLTIKTKSDRLQARLAPGQRGPQMPETFVNAALQLSIRAFSCACVLS